jgi:metal-sulfur cluster biosynthetic enzyme
VTITMQRAPAWSTDWISDDGRRKLREYGIAPPGPVDAGAGVPIRLVGRRAAPAQFRGRPLSVPEDGGVGASPRICGVRGEPRAEPRAEPRQVVPQ